MMENLKMQNRAGVYRKNLSGELEYRSFLPKPLPPDPPLELDEEMIYLLAKSNRLIGILEGLSRKIPNIELFVSMYVRKEALLSSQIEGTQASLDDILDPKIEENTNRHVIDVVNYIKASQYAVARLKELPLCNRLIKEIHAILLESVRGEEKEPGEFRHSQNWIGPAGAPLKNSVYIPPNVEDMITAISELEIFINEEDNMDPLIKIALIHYQFETIHPFLDGNGRVGRLLINLFLIENKLLSYETLYLSYFLKLNRVEYYDRLMEVRKKGNFEQWVKFFLRGTCECAEDSIQTIEKLVQLKNKNLDIISNTARSTKTIKKVFSYLEGSPIIDIGKTSRQLGISYNATAGAVNKLMELGILIQTENVLRNRVFAYEEYLNILRKNI